MRKMYSPSAGKWWVALRPPRDPSGRSSFRRSACVSSTEFSNRAKSGAVMTPVARREIFRAADRYRSNWAVEMESTSALLSNPVSDVSSPGSSAATSMSRARRSRIALPYSVRFRRCIAPVRPGFGFAEAASSRRASSQPTTACVSSSPGRGRPAGGIEPARSRAITRSHTSASALGRSGSATSSASPVSRSCASSTGAAPPATETRRSLWQATQ